MTFENVQSRSFVDIGVSKLELGNENIETAKNRIGQLFMF